MKLNQYTDWTAAAIAHWEPIIDNTLDNVADDDWSPEYDPTADKAALKSQLASHMAAFESPLLTYRNDNSREGPFIDVLFSSLFYIGNAIAAPAPSVPVNQPATIPNGTLQDLFAWWQEDLASFTGFFQVLYNGEPQMPVYNPLAEPPVTAVTGTFSLGTTAQYAAALTAINAYTDQDNARMATFQNQVQANTRKRVAYGVFAGQDAVITPTDVVPKEYLLEDMGVAEILHTFNWNIEGLNP